MARGRQQQQRREGDRPGRESRYYRDREQRNSERNGGKEKEDVEEKDDGDKKKDDRDNEKDDGDNEKDGPAQQSSQAEASDRKREEKAHDPASKDGDGDGDDKEEQRESRKPPGPDAKKSSAEDK